MADEYSNGVAKSKLKLKVDGDSSKKKKKKSKKSLDMSMVNGGVKKRDERGGQKHELLARISTNVEPNNSMESTQETTSATTTRRFTKAELAFKQQQQAMVSDKPNLGRLGVVYGVGQYNASH